MQVYTNGHFYGIVKFLLGLQTRTSIDDEITARITKEISCRLEESLKIFND